LKTVCPTICVSVEKPTILKKYLKIYSNSLTEVCKQITWLLPLGKIPDGTHGYYYRTYTDINTV
jgi:hypothetical protein